MACGQTEKVSVQLGNAQTDEYLPLLLGRQSRWWEPHKRGGRRPLVDTLLSLGVNIEHVFAPEHGFVAKPQTVPKSWTAPTWPRVFPCFRCTAPTANRNPATRRDRCCGLRHSRCGGQVLHVHQFVDVGHGGLRRAGVDVVILDRPNPHGHHMQGPMLDPSFSPSWA